MICVKKVATTTAFVLVLSGYVLAQGSVDVPSTGGAVNASKGAVDAAPSAVNRAPSAVNRAPSAVEAAPSAVESSGGRDTPSNLKARSTQDGTASAPR